MALEKQYNLIRKYKNFILLVLIVVLFIVAFMVSRSKKKPSFQLPTVCWKTTGSCDDDMFLNQLDDESLSFLLHGILTQNNKPCTKYQTFGNKKKDGGYNVCMEGKFKPEPISCNVLSFGISLDWTFDDEFSKYGCTVHSYDPSIGKQDHQRSQKHWFHNVGLGKRVEKNGNWSMVDIMTALERVGLHDKQVDVIKVDAELAEYPFLEDVITNEINVKWIILEIHSPSLLTKRISREKLLHLITLFLRLKRKGYIVSHSYQKYSCCCCYGSMFPKGIPEKCCHEVYLYNEKYLPRNVSACR